MFLQEHVSELLLFLISYIIHQYGLKKKISMKASLQNKHHEKVS